jgi:hypothetical protein
VLVDGDTLLVSLFVWSVVCVVRCPQDVFQKSSLVGAHSQLRKLFHSADIAIDKIFFNKNIDSFAATTKEHVGNVPMGLTYCKYFKLNRPLFFSSLRVVVGDAETSWTASNEGHTDGPIIPCFQVSVVRVYTVYMSLHR